MWWILGITMFVALSCYSIQGYDNKIKNRSRKASIFFRYRWMNRRCRILDRIIFNIIIFLVIATYVITLMTW